MTVQNSEMPMVIPGSAVDALRMAFAMLWEILWAFMVGFSLSAVVQAVVSKSEIKRLLPDDSAKTLTVAAAMGAASPSCSYAAAALGRSIFRKGANFTAAMAFRLASTNLVVELGISMIASVVGSLPSPLGDGGTRRRKKGRGSTSRLAEEH